MTTTPTAPPPPARAFARAVLPWALVVVGGLWLLSTLRGREPMPPGEPVPELSITLMDGQPFELAEQRGRPMLLTFWASWCPACRAEAPALQSAHERLEAAGGGAVGLAVDHRSLPAAERLGMRFPQGAVTADDLARFGVELLPTTLLVDREGRVAASFVGEVSPDRLEDALASLL
jgi:cytochrome c biogenesis protein CcmG, thiol:disulfide interchange protein DsbE